MCQSPALCGNYFWIPNVPQPLFSSNSISPLAPISTVRRPGQTQGRMSEYLGRVMEEVISFNQLQGQIQICHGKLPG